MENNGLSSNEKKILDKIGDCVKVNIPALAEKTGLSKPTVRTITDRFLASQLIRLDAAISPGEIGLDIMTVYEISYPAAMHGEKLTQHLKKSLYASNNSAVVFRINPSQAIVIAFYLSLTHKDDSFARMMMNLRKIEGKDFQPVVKELWTRPSRDFFYDTRISKFLKSIDNFNKNSKE